MHAQNFVRSRVTLLCYIDRSADEENRHERYGLGKHFAWVKLCILQQSKFEGLNKISRFEQIQILSFFKFEQIQVWKKLSLNKIQIWKFLSLNKFKFEYFLVEQILNLKRFSNVKKIKFEQVSNLNSFRLNKFSNLNRFWTLSNFWIWPDF
jgi:hypothetical protein